jgi:hypothetical protein
MWFLGIGITVLDWPPGSVWLGLFTAAGRARLPPCIQPPQNRTGVTLPQSDYSDAL